MSFLSVKKFGGTSVGSIERIEHVADLIHFQKKSDNQDMIIVLSAMSGETNRLINLAHQVSSKSHGGPAYDLLLASGEQVSISLLSLALQKRGIESMPLLAFQLGIQTNSIYSKARIENIKTDKISELISDGVIPIVAGFQGIDLKDRVTTLGRGGSDTTAVALAAALKANECEIYTDVKGVYTSDPRVVPQAQKISSLSYQEMMEMASLGSKVLHFRCVEIAAKYKVPLHVRSTFDEGPGTWIQKEEKDMEAPLVSAITQDSQITIISAEPVPTGVSFLSQLFEQLHSEDIVVDIISQSKSNEGQRIAFSIHDEDADKAMGLYKKLLPEVQVQTLTGVSKVSVVGVGMRSHPGVAALFFKTLNEHNVDISLVTTSDIKMSAVISSEKVAQAVQSLHKVFGLDA